MSLIGGALARFRCTVCTCPSWRECGEDGGYCFPDIGKSKCITEELGCICGGCPVAKMMELKNIYFCTQGSEPEQNAGGDCADTIPALTPFLFQQFLGE